MARPRLIEPIYRLRPRGGIHYVNFTEAGRTRSVSTGCRERADAEAWLRRFIAGRLSTPAPRQPTVAQILDAYGRDRDGQVTAPERIGYATKALNLELGDLQPADIGQEVSRRYIRARRDAGRSDGTIGREIIVLRAALAWAVRAKWIAAAPHVEAPPRPRPRHRWLTRDEARRLIDGAVKPHVRLFIVLALHTAARRGALLSLTWDRVDLDRRLIHLALPGRANRTKRRAIVPINGRGHWFNPSRAHHINQ